MSFVEGSISVDIVLAPGALERLKANLVQLEKGINLKVNIDPSSIQAGVRGIDSLNASAQRAANSISQRLGGALKGAGVALGALAAVGATGLISIATKAIQAGKEFNILQQQVRAGLTAVLGTAAAAEQLLTSVNKLNDTSPFPRSAFLSATQQLVGFGVSADKVIPILDAIQEAVAGIGGSASDIQLFTRAFAQIQSQGRLTGDVLFTLGAKGVDAAKIIGDQMGKTGQEIKDAVTRGTIGASQAIDLLTKGLKEKFKGSVENVAKSFIGAMDRVQARLRDIGADITAVFINPFGGGAAVKALNNIAVGLSNIRKNVISQLIPTLEVMADLFVRATKAFVDFTANIKTDQVQKFLEIFKTLVPLIALFATRLVGSVISAIPVFARLGTALGGPLVALGLIIATVPQLRQAFLDLVDVLTPLVQALLPVFNDSLNIAKNAFVALVPLLAVAAVAVEALVSVLTPLINVLQGLGIASPILTLIIGKLLLTKLAASAAFGSFSTGAAGAVGSLRGLAQSFTGLLLNLKIATSSATTFAGTLRAVGSVGVSTLAGVGRALLGLVNPTTAAITAITIMGNLLAEADKKAKKLAETATKGLDFQVNKDVDAGIANLEALLDVQRKINNEAQKFGGRAQSFFAWLPFVANNGINSARAIDELNKQIAELEGSKSIKSVIISDAIARTGATAEQVSEVVKKLAIDLAQVSPLNVLTTVDKIVNALTELPSAAENAAEKIKTALTTQADLLDKVRAAQDALSASQKSLDTLRRVSAQELKDNVTKAELSLAAARDSVRAASERVISAELSLAQAQRGTVQAQERLVEVTKARNLLLADTTRETRELADADAALARIDAELIDQAERKIELENDLTRLGTEGPDKLAAADRAIERAKIAVNTATREQIALQNELNAQDAPNVDFSGLTIEQVKARIAATKAALAAQKSTEKQAKSQQQIDDEAKTVGLNKLDAEQALKDAIQARADLETSLNTQKREDEQALASLAIDHEASLRRQFEQQQEISKLRAGDTQTARELKALNEELVTSTDAVKASVIALHTAEDGVRDSKREQQTLTIDIRDKEREVEASKRAQVQHYKDIQTAESKVAEDAQKVSEATALTLDDNKLINAALVERISLSSALLKQQPELAANLVEQILGPVITGPFQRGSPELAAQSLRNSNGSELLDILLNHPDRLLDFLRKLGLQLANGAIVNQATFATIGEAGREVVLPLTRPARLSELLSHNDVLHPVLAALGRISLPTPAIRRAGTNVITSSTLSPIKSITSGLGVGSNVMIRRADGPMTYGQAEAIITLLEANGKTELRVEAPITVNSSVDEVLLSRKITRQVEQKVSEILNRR